jgi:hypothetical protein
MLLKAHLLAWKSHFFAGQKSCCLEVRIIEKVAISNSLRLAEARRGLENLYAIGFVGNTVLQKGKFASASSNCQIFTGANLYVGEAVDKKILSRVAVISIFRGDGGLFRKTLP